MIKLKTKWFNKWAKKNSIVDKTLLDTIDFIEKRLNAVKLGNGLFKVRTPKSGQGKSSGFRTILVFKKYERAIFVYGFAKSDKSNLNEEELKYFKILAKDLLAISDEEYRIQIKLGNFFTIKEDK